MKDTPKEYEEILENSLAFLKYLNTCKFKDITLKYVFNLIHTFQWDDGEVVLMIVS